MSSQNWTDYYEYDNVDDMIIMVILWCPPRTEEITINEYDEYEVFHDVDDIMMSSSNVHVFIPVNLYAKIF